MKITDKILEHTQIMMSYNGINAGGHNWPLPRGHFTIPTAQSGSTHEKHHSLISAAICFVTYFSLDHGKDG